MRRNVFVLYLFLAGCASAPLPPPAPTVVCLPLKTYAPDEQKALGAAVAALPPTSPLIGAMLDYSAMREGDRAACAAH